MDDRDLLTRIDELVKEEHRLTEQHIGDGEGLRPAEEERLRQLEVALDQCWDLLRQRRARRNAGLDPDEADVRPPSIVETYQQ